MPNPIGNYKSALDFILAREHFGIKLLYVDYTHPVFEIFRGPRSGDFTGARFFRAREIQLADPEASRVLARYDDGSVAMAERSVGDGQVLVLTSTVRMRQKPPREP